MNAINWKKLLLPNIPYLLFVYLFDKVGQAVRLSPGADLSGKVLSLGEGFSMAFATPLPSLAPMDLLIGIFGAVLIRLIVYVKGKNAKKYRKGIEYGSARWGTAEDIKPYTDPVFQNNVLLTQTERLTMNSRPKQPKYARNKNILVIGVFDPGRQHAGEAVLCIAEKFLILPIAFAQHHKLDAKIHHAVQRFTDQIQALVGYQAADHRHNGKIRILPQPHFPLQRRLTCGLTG